MIKIESLSVVLMFTSYHYLCILRDALLILMSSPAYFPNCLYSGTCTKILQGPITSSNKRDIWSPRRRSTKSLTNSIRFIECLRQVVQTPFSTAILSVGLLHYRYNILFTHDPPAQKSIGLWIKSKQAYQKVVWKIEIKDDHTSLNLTAIPQKVLKIRQKWNNPPALNITFYYHPPIPQSNGTKRWVMSVRIDYSKCRRHTLWY